MPGRAKSATLKVREERDLHDDLMARAVEAYRIELLKRPGARRRSMRTVCDDFQDINLKATGKLVKLSHATMDRLLRGGKTLQQSNSCKGYLTDEETEIIISFINECGNRGFPLSHRRLREHVEQILGARLGLVFRPEGLGRNWTYRFVEKHYGCIKTSWSVPLEEKRGQGANPHSNKVWWKLLGDTLNTYNIKPENIYGVDEVGIQPQGGERERVIGGCKKAPQYQQRAGTRENITVLVTICADGTSQAPAVIFKGNAYQMKWQQNNPLNASIGYQKKGWTDGEIGAEWIKIFEKETVEKANGEYRLLLVDGHNSHYTLAFLQHARLNQIIILCYPAHTTHIYQGLDVVIFAGLKHFLSEERDKWLREHGKVIDKTTFLEIYGHAHLRAITKDTILAAFRKTGVHPFNPDIVTEDMLAPSKETSIQGHLPLPPPTPVRAIARLIEKLSINDDSLDDIKEETNSHASGSSPSTPTPGASTSQLNSRTKAAFEEAVKTVSQTDLAYLFSSTKLITSSDPMHTTRREPMSLLTQQKDIASIIPKTPNEIMLMAALREAQETAERFQHRVIELQASNILNEIYCNKLRFQLANKEEKKGKLKGKLVGDGLPKMLTGDEFYERVVEFTKWQKEQECLKAERLEDTAGYRAELAAWKEKEKERKEKNKKQTEAYQKELAAWNERREKAKSLRKLREFKELKPKRGPLLKATPKPKRTIIFDDEEEDDADVEREPDEDSDGDGNDDDD